MFHRQDVHRSALPGFFLHSSVNPLQDGTPSVQTRYVKTRTPVITGGITAWNENRSWKWGSAVKLSHVRQVHGRQPLTSRPATNTGVTGGDQLNGSNDATALARDGQDDDGITQLPYHRGRFRPTGMARRMSTTPSSEPRRHQYGRAFLTDSRGAFQSLPFLNAGVPTGQTSKANNDVYSWNTFSPRIIGLNYQVTESGNTVIKAHYGSITRRSSRRSSAVRCLRFRWPSALA